MKLKIKYLLLLAIIISSVSSYACAWVCYQISGQENCFGTDRNCTSFSTCVQDGSCKCSPCVISTNYTFTSGLVVRFDGDKVYTNVTGTPKLICDVTSYLTSGQVFTMSYNTVGKIVTMNIYTASLLSSGLSAAFVTSYTFAI